MKRTAIIGIASAIAMGIWTGMAFTTPVVNGVTIETRTFNDCPISTLTVVNHYPASIEITDAMNPLCVGFANLHSFSLSEDGGATSAVFDNNSNFRFAADVRIDGAGEGEGGLRISPWYGKFVDGRFMLNVTNGEIAVFGGALPFYSFTFNHGVHYTRGTTAHLEVEYRAHDLTETHPATIQYRLVYGGTTYESPVLAFGMQNLAECDPYGLWGMLNDGRVGGYFQARANTGASLHITWSNIEFECLPSDGTPLVNAATIEARTFNDCPISTLTVVNDYPAMIQITDVMNSLCVGFANLHSFSLSEDGGATSAVFDNNANFRLAADVRIDGAGEGEGGLRISPWYGKFVDGRFMLNTNGEISVFGGALPFYSFTVNHDVHYVRGTTARLEMAYAANDLTEDNPATIQYRLEYGGSTYESPVLAFGEQNAAECEHGLWGMLNDGRVGGYFQPRANTGESLRITWSDITYSHCPLAANIAFHPNVLNLAARGRWLGVTIEPEGGAAAGDIDLTSIRLNGTEVVDPSGPSSVGDSDGDGIADLTVKFLRSDVVGALSAGDDVVVTITGNLGCECFEGTAHLRVIGPPGPVAGGGRSSGGEARDLAQSGAEAGISLAVESVRPNPTRSEFGVTFRLPGNDPANLSVYDVTGRRVASMEVGALGAGQHTVVFGKQERLAAGVYLIQLTQVGQRVTARATVMK